MDIQRFGELLKIKWDLGFLHHLISASKKIKQKWGKDDEQVRLAYKEVKNSLKEFRELIDRYELKIDELLKEGD